MKTAAHTAISGASRCRPGVRRGLAGLLRAALLGVVMAPSMLLAQGWGGSLGYGSDNVYRGVSQSSGLPGWSLDLHYGADHEWLIGLGATAERPPAQSAGAQLRLYIDRIWEFDEDWSGKIGVVHYESPWNLLRDELRYTDLTAALAYRGRWGASIAISPDTPRTDLRGRFESGMASSAELTYRQPIVGRLAADFGLGYADAHGIDQDYRYGSAGISYAVGDFHAFVNYLWNDAESSVYQAGQDIRPGWVTYLLWTF